MATFSSLFFKSQNVCEVEQKPEYIHNFHKTANLSFLEYLQMSKKQMKTKKIWNNELHQRIY